MVNKPAPPIIGIIQHWLDNVQYLPGFFIVKDEGYLSFQSWVIEDTLPVYPVVKTMRNSIRFDADKLECHFGNEIRFSVHDPRFFEKLDWFLAGKWNMILAEWPLDKSAL